MRSCKMLGQSAHFVKELNVFNVNAGLNLCIGFINCENGLDRSTVSACVLSHSSLALLCTWSCAYLYYNVSWGWLVCKYQPYM